MTIRRLFICLLLALGVIVAFNVLLAYRIGSVSKYILHKMNATPQIDILFLGNSLMQSGLDTDVFTSAWPPKTPAPQVFNAGMGSSSPVEHYLLAHQAYIHHQHIPVLVYGFFDLQLTEHIESGWDDLTGNRAMDYTTEPAAAAEFYVPGSLAEKWRFLAIGAVPMLREHSELWKYVELLRRSMGEVGLPHAATNQFGRVADFREHVFPTPAVFNQNCELAVRDSASLVPAFAEILHLAHEKGTQVIIVEMPMTTLHRTGYYALPSWQNYRAYLRQKLQAEGVTVVIADDWITNDARFTDGLHLDAGGAREFSTQIAQYLAGALPPN